jgi:Protein of unknown function (DUF3096)
MDASALLGPRAAPASNASRAPSFPERAVSYAAFSGNFCEQRNSMTPCASPISEPVKLECRPRTDSRITGALFSMTITSAHIPAIVALIAGLLILIMPRLLNFIVAIYLIVIGLVGLGLLHWLHM